MKRKRQPVPVGKRRRSVPLGATPPPPRQLPSDRTIRAWSADAPKPQATPSAPSKQEIYETEICAFVNHLRISNSDEFRRKIAEEQFALRAANGAIRNMLYVQDGDQSQLPALSPAGKQAKDVLGWA